MTIDNTNTDYEITSYKKNLQKVLNQYQIKYPEVKNLSQFTIESFNIQKYPKKGGFKEWH